MNVNGHRNTVLRGDEGPAAVLAGAGASALPSGQRRQPPGRSKKLGKRGSVAVEFGLIAPLLALILAAILEIGLAIAVFFNVQGGAMAGANFASQHGWDPAGITNAVTTATGGVSTTAFPAPTTFCGCPSGAKVVSAVCGSTCADGVVTRKYATVSATRTRPRVVSQTFGMPGTITVTMTTKLP